VGAVIGNAAGSTTKGAAAGAIIGSRMNDRAETLAAELPNATIERVGEGILVTFDSGILFGFDSSDLRAQARNNLGDLARVLAEDSDDYELLVAGHTDASGAEAYNQTLSERRASAASDHLATQGIPSTQIRIQGLGETEPVASNETTSGQEANRRVEVAIFASAEYRNEAIRQTRN
jgi:outer membrane protein OmpA-like peptidoglycan-associated protein